MDFGTVQRDNHGLYTKLYQESPSPYIPTMEEVLNSSSSSSSNSHASGKIFMNNLDYVMVEGSLNSLFYSPFYDPFDPFQANSFGKLNQEFSAFGQDGGPINPCMQGCPSRRLLDVVNGDTRTCFPTMDHQFQMSDQFDDYLEQDSCLNVEANQKTNEAKAHNKRKRFVDEKSEIVKGQWTPEEDGLLVELVEKHGVRKWSSVAQMLPGRIGKQCRERWHNHLKPNIKKDRWSEEEDRILIEAHRQLGNKWAEIARSLPGRSENTIKNHWNATKRRQLSSRKNSNSKSNSPLQNYIKSVMSSSDDKGCPENYSSGSASPADVPMSKSKHVESCSMLKPKIEAADDSFKLQTTSLETQMHVQYDIQKEKDFMEMLSHGYI